MFFTTVRLEVISYVWYKYKPQPNIIYIVLNFLGFILKSFNSRTILGRQLMH